MKLKDKTTGKVRTFDFVVISDDYRRDGEITKFSRPFHILVCRSIEQLNEEWEDYKPKEPLIKDEKVRKAVRAWAEANDFVRVFYEYDYNNDVAVFMVGESKMIIESDELLDDSKDYSIAELCGDSEEDE